MGKASDSVNDIIRGYRPKRWGVADFKRLDVVKSYGSYSTSINRFVNLNRPAFQFLGLTVCGEEGFANEIRLERSRFCGVVPLRGAESGQVIGSLSVDGAYGEDIPEIITAIGADVEVEFNPGFMLTSASPLTPPIYLECLRYIDLYTEAERVKWRKFQVVERTEPLPRGITDWSAYASKSLANPQHALRFPNRFNSLTTHHAEWLNLTAILSVALEEVLRPAVPVNARLRIMSRVERLRAMLRNTPLPSAPSLPVVHNPDPEAIKQLKLSGAAIMQSQTSQRCAWRIDQALLFERYVQHVARKALEQVGGTLTCNPHIGISGFRAPWTLSCLEPDAVGRLGTTTLIIDAKYKSHLLNRSFPSPSSMGKPSLSASSNSTYSIGSSPFSGSSPNNSSSTGPSEFSTLDDTFRHDLHQILAYASMAPNSSPFSHRHAMLVYPSTTFLHHTQQFHSTLLHQTNLTLHLIGLPFHSTTLPANILHLASLFRTML